MKVLRSAFHPHKLRSIYFMFSGFPPTQTQFANLLQVSSVTWIFFHKFHYFIFRSSKALQIPAQFYPKPLFATNFINGLKSPILIMAADATIQISEPRTISHVTNITTNFTKETTLRSPSEAEQRIPLRIVQLN